MRRSEQVANAVRQVVELRKTGSCITDHAQRRRVERVADEILAGTGGSVPKSGAARLLGISTTALDHWIDVGALPVVRRSGSSREEVAAGPFLKLLLRVKRLRAAGLERGVIATALRDLNVTSRCGSKASSLGARPLKPNLPDEELRHDYRLLGPSERIAQATRLSRQATRLAAIGERERRGSR